MKRAKIIGIGGVSRSGKSTLAQKVKNSFEGTVLILDQDEFVKSQETIPRINNRTDWEHPKSIDFEKLKAEVNLQKNNYDLIIVEGLLAFYDVELTAIYDLTVGMKVSKERFLERRKQENRWGDEPKWYIEHVWESYLKYGQYKANIVFDDWNGEVLKVLEKIV